ncbi:MAG: hypothetical protein GOVbin3205_62 [Prokaryotic dsDNA virus sp.]|nr:MAG: hypothetical protein GOVbin3205_62 [Prokaryotic dsDNA virus sp.]
MLFNNFTKQLPQNNFKKRDVFLVNKLQKGLSKIGKTASVLSKIRGII